MSARDKHAYVPPTDGVDCERCGCLPATPIHIPPTTHHPTELPRVPTGATSSCLACAWLHGMSVPCFCTCHSPEPTQEARSPEPPEHRGEGEAERRSCLHLWACSTCAAVAKTAVDDSVATLQKRLDEMERAVKEHHAQKADDRCIEDDDRLYATFGLPPCDRRVGDKAAMLANCARFIDRRCEAGGWPTYVELEARLDEMERALRDVDAVLRVPAAEYVPAIGDAFAIIDRALSESPRPHAPEEK